MSSVRGRVQDGKLELDGPLPPEWRDGVEVEARLAPAEAGEWGMREEDWPTTPAGIEEWCAWAKSIEPVFKTREEQDEFDRILAEDKAWELSTWEARNKKIERLFQ